MTSKSATICVDSNLVLRLVLGGPLAESVRDLWEEWIQEDKALIAPPLLAFEVTSVIWREVYSKRLSMEQGQQALQVALKQDIHLEHPGDLHDRAFELAQRFDLPQAYDTHYVALAEHFNCDFWTLDRKLYDTLSAEFPWVHTVSGE